MAIGSTFNFGTSVVRHNQGGYGLPAGRASQEALGERQKMFGQYEAGLAGTQALREAIKGQMLSPTDLRAQAADTMTRQHALSRQRIQDTIARNQGVIGSGGQASLENQLAQQHAMGQVGAARDARVEAARANADILSRALAAEQAMNAIRGQIAGARAATEHYTPGAEMGAGGFTGGTRIFGRKTPGSYGSWGGSGTSKKSTVKGTVSKPGLSGGGVKRKSTKQQQPAKSAANTPLPNYGGPTWLGGIHNQIQRASWNPFIESSAPNAAAPSAPAPAPIRPIVNSMKKPPKFGWPGTSRTSIGNFFVDPRTIGASAGF